MLPRVQCGAQALAAALGKLPQLTSLVLQLERNSIGDSGAKAIAAALGKLPQLTSLTLNLDGNSVGASGAKAIEAARRQVRLNLALARLEAAEHTNNANGREERDQPGERREISRERGVRTRQKRDKRREKRE